MTGLIILSILATILMLTIDYQDHHLRNIMKRITILIAVAITIALAGCGGQSHSGYNDMGYLAQTLQREELKGGFPLVPGTVSCSKIANHAAICTLQHTNGQWEDFKVDISRDGQHAVPHWATN